MALTVEKKVGIFFVISMLILGGLLEIGEKWNPFETKIMYKTYLTTITGLKVGDPVRLAGVDVGKIDKITILDEKVQIDFEVKPGTKIKTDTYASLRLTNLLGGQFLGLSFGSPKAAMLPPGSTVTGKDVGNIDIIVDNVSDLTRDAKLFVDQLNKNQNRVMGQISAILDDNRAPLRDSIANINSITTKLDRGENSLSLLLNDKLLYNNVYDTVASLKSVSAKIEKGEGTLGKLVNDDAIYNDAKSVIANLNTGVKDLNSGMADVREMTAKVRRGEGTLGKLINDEVLYSDAREAVTNIKDITRKLNQGEGTLGKLINEDKMYRDVTSTLKKAEKAIEGLGDTGPISVLGSILGTLF
jgi:phospholipid/cholesterol/gamma-HCH transport system substrate-binding protein